MPKVFTFGSFVIFFWMGEDGEPVHVHVSVKRPEPNATKFWLLANGGCALANNNSNIDERDLRKIARAITINHKRICSAWSETFGADNMHFIQ